MTLFAPHQGRNPDSAVERDRVGAGIVIDGLCELDIRGAMRAGIGGVYKLGRASGVVRISAGDYGGKLGKYHFRLREIMA